MTSSGRRRSQHLLDGALHHDSRLQDCLGSTSDRHHPAFHVRKARQEGQEPSSDYGQAGSKHVAGSRVRSCYRESNVVSCAVSSVDLFGVTRRWICMPVRFKGSLTFLWTSEFADSLPPRHPCSYFALQCAQFPQGLVGRNF
jgi:hypothetical protein